MKDQKIIVGIDIRDLQVAKTGQRTVIEEFCKQFRNSTDQRFRFIFFDSTIPIYTGKKKFLLLLEHIKYQLWKQVTLPFKAWRHKCDILFCGDYFVPLIQPGFKTVEIFYDAFFFEYPEHYNKLWLKLFHAIAIPGARKSPYIMTITEYAKQKIHDHTGIPTDKLVTIYPGPKTELKKNIEKEIPEHLSVIKGKKYILHVGVLEKRKNLPTLIKAFKLLRDAGYNDYSLVLVGKGNGKTFSDDTDQVVKAISENHLEDHVIQLGYLSDEEVGIIYQHAFMYVFPSFNEGFGIPIMEAFSFKLPVIVANNSCLPEVGGDAVLSFNPYKEEEIFQQMKKVIDDESVRNELIRKGTERLRHFSWEKAAKELMDIFEKAYKDKG